MNDFDLKAKGWDDNPVHMERSVAIAEKILEHLSVIPGMRAMEYGAGTGSGHLPLPSPETSE